MRFLVSNKPQFGLLAKTLLILVTSVFLQTGFVNAEEVPPGFKRLAIGGIIVDDVLKAVPLPAPIMIAANNEIEEVPPGFHRMGNGDIMANFPSKAVAPPGYRLTEGGILRKLDDTSADNKQPSIAGSAAMVEGAAKLDEVPPGFHRMANGSIMANYPSKAVAPEGYYLMPDGTLMVKSSDNTGADLSANQNASGGGGMWMFDYEYSRMYMKDMLDSTTTVTAAQAVDPAGIYNYMMAPTDMTMDMHMAMIMYHARNYMIMGMLHYMSNEMGMLSVDGTTSTMESSGLADTVVTATFPGPKSLSFMVGVSIPTGSIDERGPMTHLAGVVQQDVKYPYGMQLGSGSYELKQGIGYESAPGFSQWGLSYEYDAVLNENDNDYKRGNTLLIDGWMKWQFTSTFSTTAKVEVLSIEQIEGVDAELDLNKDMSPTMDATLYGGRRVDLGVGIRYENAKMTSVSLDITAPVYQNLYGPQMQTQWIATIGLGFMF